MIQFQRSNRPKLADFAFFRGVLPKFAQMMLARRRKHGEQLWEMRWPIGALRPHSASAAIESNILGVFQPQRGGMSIVVEQEKITGSVRSGIGDRHAAPLGLFSYPGWLL